MERADGWADRQIDGQREDIYDPFFPHAYKNGELDYSKIFHSIKTAFRQLPELLLFILKMLPTTESYIDQTN